MDKPLSKVAVTQLKSDRIWADLERTTRSVDQVMRGSDVGAKMTAVGRLQSLGEDLYAALQDEDEGDE
jgi:hypothetical protein